MLRDITLGQFFPGSTVVHRLDPRTKIVLLIVFIVALFNAVSWWSYGLVLAATAAVMILGHITPKNILPIGVQQVAMRLMPSSAKAVLPSK